MSQRLSRLILIVMVAVVAVFVVVVLLMRDWRQTYNIRLANQHVLKLRPLLAEDEQFEHLQLGHYTGQGGAIWVIGRVPDETSSLRLREIVESIDPPVSVRYSIDILSRLEAELAD